LHMGSLRSLLVLSALALVQVVGAGCSKEGGGEESQNSDGSSEVPEALSGFVVAKGDASLVFQFVDPTTGHFSTTQDPEAVPEKARENVIVFPSGLPKGAIPAGLVILADLSKPDDAGNYPFRLVSRYGSAPLPSSAEAPAGSGPEQTTSTGSDAVILFTTKWCPHCRTARQWLTSQGIKYVEKDVEADSTAVTMLQKLGQEQGIPQQMLTSVPIVAVNGTLVVGFDQAKITQLLERK